MKPIMYNQKWFTINKYPLDYYELLFLYYSTCARSIPVTYYSTDLNNSVCDKTILDAGPYDKMSDLSGMLWNKILLLQVYQPDTLSLNFTADEKGFGKFDQVTTFWIPTIYEIRPQIHDFVYFDNIEKRGDQFKANQSLYEVVNFEKATNTELTFWKLFLKVSYQRKNEIDEKISDNFTFINYENKIYRTDNAIFLAKIADKNHSLNGNEFYNQTCGLYLGLTK